MGPGQLGGGALQRSFTGLWVGQTLEAGVLLVQRPLWARMQGVGVGGTGPAVPPPPDTLPPPQPPTSTRLTPDKLEVYHRGPAETLWASERLEFLEWQYSLAWPLKPDFWVHILTCHSSPEAQQVTLVLGAPGLFLHKGANDRPSLIDCHKD